MGARPEAGAARVGPRGPQASGRPVQVRRGRPRPAPCHVGRSAGGGPTGATTAGRRSHERAAAIRRARRWKRGCVRIVRKVESRGGGLQGPPGNPGRRSRCQGRGGRPIQPDRGPTRRKEHECRRRATRRRKLTRGPAVRKVAGGVDPIRRPPGTTQTGYRFCIGTSPPRRAASFNPNSPEERRSGRGHPLSFRSVSPPPRRAAPAFPDVFAPSPHGRHTHR